jgi:PAS domain S-box-containing protein
METKGTESLKHKRTVLEIVAYIAVSTILIFYTDASTPLGLMVWILYFIPLFLTLYLRWKYAPFVATGVFIFLIAVSYFISPRDMSALFALLNRVFFSLMLIVLSFFIWSYTRNMEKLWIDEEHYRYIAECSPDAIMVYKDGKILYANLSSRRFFNAESREDLIGKDIVGMFVPDEQQNIRNKMRQSVMGARTVIDRIRVLRVDGTEVQAQVSLGNVVWDREPALLVSMRPASIA